MGRNENRGGCVLDAPPAIYRARAVRWCSAIHRRATPVTAFIVRALTRELDPDRPMSAFDVYQPYLEDRRLFSSTRAQAILQPLNVRCPPFTYERFRVCMDYAIKTGWGRMLGLG